MDESCTILLLDRLKFIIFDNELLLSLIILILVQMMTGVDGCGGGGWGVLAGPAKKLTIEAKTLAGDSEAIRPWLVGEGRELGLGGGEELIVSSPARARNHCLGGYSTIPETPESPIAAFWRPPELGASPAACGGWTEIVEWLWMPAPTLGWPPGRLA